MKTEIMWAFAWVACPHPYITSQIHWSRRDVKFSIENLMGQPWRKTYRQGGRIIKVKVSPA